MAEARAVAKFIRVAPRKARAVVDLIRGKTLSEARTILEFTPRAAARVVKKVLDSAAANAEFNHHLKLENLYIKEARVDQGPALKRYRPRAMGRASMIKHYTSHIKIVLAERGGKD